MKREAARIAGVLGIGAFLLGLGCAEDYEPFNELSKLRVLAIRAEPPDLLPGEGTEISALVYEPDGDDLEYRWSWCPVAAGAATGFECVVDEQDLRDMAAGLFPGAEALVPSLDLGREPTAAFQHSIPPAILQGMCDAILSSGAPSFVTLPDCEEELVVTVRLVVSGGGESVTAVKELALKMSADAEVNSNPAIGAVVASPAGGGGEVVLEEGSAVDLEAGAELELAVAVPREAAEEYTPEPTEEEPDPQPTTESLFMSWFVTDGSTLFGRTTYLDGEIGLDELGSNTWTLPDAEDAPEGEAALFLVLQDERGGVAWTSRQVAVVER